MNNLVSGLLKINCSTEGGKLTVTFFGKSSIREPGTVLTPFFADILKSAPSELVLQFDKLEFMNSSTMPPVAQFLDKLEKQGIRTTIVYDEKSNWQNVAFRVLKKITEHFKRISFITR